MRKIFSKLAIVLTASTLTFPLTACVYNFYISPPKDAVARSLADQTSSVIKSLVMSKEKDADTAQSVTDMLQEFPNSSISNLTNGSNISNWDQFSSKWGFEGNINTQGFNPSEYFKATGSGATTQQVNSYRDLNNTLSQANLISGLAVADNPTLYNLLNGKDIRQPVIDFLNQTKETNPDNASTIIKLLKNTVVGADWQNPDPKAFSKNFVEPLTSLLNYLVKGEWAPGVKTPETPEEMKSFMNNWVDSGGKPYSQWTTNGNWKLQEKYWKDWDYKTDFNFYRSGVLVNHLFYTIGNDYQIQGIDKDGVRQEYKDRYLGDIISNGKENTNYLMEDLNQYINHLLDNPSYIITLVEVLVPVIKHWGLQMSDISQGVKHLTFGKKYKTNDEENSYNIADILENIRQIIADPDKLITILEDLLGLTDHYNANPDDLEDDEENERPKEQKTRINPYITSTVGVPGGSFTYDIGVNALFVAQPLPTLYDGQAGKQLRPPIRTLVHETVPNALNDMDINGIFNNIIYIYNQWINQYDEKNDGIDVDLEKLQDFLLNEDNGLATVINRDMMDDGALFKIMNNKDPITDDNLDEYYELYKSLGGQIEGNNIPTAFRPNSAIDVIKKTMDDTNEPLGQIALILLGKSSKNINGLFAYIIDSNNQWISDNYSSFFDVQNKSIGQIYNLSMTNNDTEEALSDTLNYNFKYNINGRTYVFSIQAKSWNLKHNFIGTKTFYFTDINLESIK